MGIYDVPVREPPAWRLDCRIGSGTFGNVFLEKVQTRLMDSPELWAVKRIPKAVPNFPARRYQEEIKNLQALLNVSSASLHPSLTDISLIGLWWLDLTYRQYEWFVKFKASYEDDHFVYIAMEYISIGDMSRTFVGGYLWNESDARVVVRQLLHGLAVMHKAGITHRDLKPEVCILPDKKIQQPKLNGH